MKITTGIALAASVALSPAVTAEIVDLAWTGNSQYSIVNWGYDASLNWDGGMIADQGPGKLGLYEFNGGAQEGYCWDLDAPVSQASTPYEIVEFSALDSELQARFTFLASLYDQWYEDVKEVGATDYNLGAAMGTALALLTNEIMEENYDFVPGTWILEDVQLQSSTSMGAVQFSSLSPEAEFFYGEMLMSLDFGTQAMIDGLVIYESEDGFQSFVGYVPAPSAMALLGLAGLAGRRRRND